MLPGSVYTFYNMIILEEIEPSLVGTKVVAKAQNIPPGISIVYRNELKKLRGAAKRGHPGDPVPHEVGRIQPKATYVVEHIHGFDIPEQDMLAAAQPQNNTIIKLPEAAARASARLVAESIEDTVFNGIPELGAPGIYADAGANDGDGYGVTTEWDKSSGADPYADIVGAAELLEETSRYHAMFAVVSAKALRMFSRRNSFGISYASMIEDASDRHFFPNGMEDFHIGPMPANKYSDDAETTLSTPILGGNDVGLIGDFGNRVAERYVQSLSTGLAISDVLNDGAQGQPQADNPQPQGDIALREYLPGRDNLYPYNIQTFQGLDIHYLDAFCALSNTMTSA